MHGTTNKCFYKSSSVYDIENCIIESNYAINRIPTAYICINKYY